ncbi:DUF262 domain-containing HNH endonuclease family protein [Flavobacterium sp. SH_e]|uniref:DUF262 domain-containing protein n=1 Tax=Flavobacterium sp. SH_e TaxID=2983767 RepID=UPI0021E4631F|nr:DUF262 domain-containing HNH endonuclease family protein [Flavobacterium sp. SH_e]MCV2486508.1 DUF262 domain-containing HNH endonuclease family protein [Flavobacterium sp. SH_e]
MLSASKEKLLSFLNGSSQYIIPFFQRSYVWKTENWAELWENILEEYNELNNNNFSEHFIGTIIIKQVLSQRVGATEYELIDGQQRLTTVCVLLRAFYDVTEEQSAKTWIKNFFTFVDSYGEENIRIKHSKVDTVNFQNIVQDKNGNNNLWNEYKDLKIEDLEKKIESISNIIGAYIYFRYRISKDCDIVDVRKYVNVIIERLPVIHMALNAEDDVQQIFDTINSLGVKLTTAELLKNHLYANKCVVDYYEDYWYSIFEADEDIIEFWNREKTSGRVRRTTVELFLYSYLVIIKEGNVKMETLFKEFKNYLNGKSDSELIAFAKELQEYAIVYQEMPDGENLSEISYKEHEKRFFHLIKEFDITTIFPLILFIYKNVQEIDERIAILKVLESYITRRTICKFTTKNYNNLFLSLLAETKQMSEISADSIKGRLLDYTEVTNKFPTNEEFKAAFGTSHLINKYSREVLYCIALYELDHAFADNPRLNFEGFSVEHIMPKNWIKNWKQLPEGIEADFRRHKLLTLGNLTLIRGKLNSSMRDSSWKKKKDALLKYSTLRQTTDYIHNEEWSENNIKEREDKLFDIAIKMWER